ncbi:TPM domain-containing protein [Massilia sp. TSP1-1-2]|uniref:TPM domain-containing protein n=1 Tax=unclassified Massilia TaxID=2609279 RepID=UPI003CF711AD
MTTTFIERIKRQWRHWLASAAKGRRLFPADALTRLGQAITAGEQRHRGELRLIVENALPSELIWADVGNRQRALSLFAEYGVWDTADRCGVLIYVNLAEQKVDIVADRNIGQQIAPDTWQQICRGMTEGFKAGQFEQSTLAAIEQVNVLLAARFPATGERANELPDQPVML